jgi:hypothetical protein
MPRNGSGTYTLPPGNPVVSGTSISSTVQNTTMSDVAAELTNSIAADGQKTPTANLPMGNFRHTGVSNATARNQYAAAGQVQDGGFVWCGTAGGTADAITLSPIPSITAYSAGQTFRFIALGPNTIAAVTVNVSGLGTKSLTKLGATALSAGDMSASTVYEITYDGTQFQLKNVNSLNSTGGTLTGLLSFAKGADIASASTVNLATATGNSVNLTGTTAVTAWTMNVGQIMRVNFTAATPITYNATTNRIQGGSSITGEVGSYLIVYYDGTTTFVDYVLGSGAAAAGPSYTTVPADITTTGATLTNQAVGVVTKVNSASATTTTLMASSALVIGQSFTLSNVGAGIATFSRVGSDAIYGNNLVAATSIVLNQGESVTLTYTAANTLLVTASNVSFFGAKATSVATTSGTSVDYLLPSGTTEFTIALSGVSLSSTANLLIQIGSGTVTTSGYVSTSVGNQGTGSQGVSSTAGFVIYVNNAAGSVSGQVTCRLIAGTLWNAAHNTKRDTSLVMNGSGEVTLSGAIDRVRITTTTGTDTFDAGLINIVGVR